MSKEAMKLALEAMMYADACLKKQLTTKDKHEYAQDLLLEAGAALKQALEQPEPETVECHTCKGLGGIYMGCGSWIHCDTCNITGKATTQPKREWQGLTDEEIGDFASGYRSGRIGSFVELTESIEAKLKEKNNG